MADLRVCMPHCDARAAFLDALRMLDVRRVPEPKLWRAAHGLLIGSAFLVIEQAMNRCRIAPNN